MLPLSGIGIGMTNHYDYLMTCEWRMTRLLVLLLFVSLLNERIYFYLRLSVGFSSVIDDRECHQEKVLFHSFRRRSSDCQKKQEHVQRGSPKVTKAGSGCDRDSCSVRFQRVVLKNHLMSLLVVALQWLEWFRFRNKSDPTFCPVQTLILDTYHNSKCRSQILSRWQSWPVKENYIPFRRIYSNH